MITGSVNLAELAEENMYELDTLYSHNGHKPDYDIRDNSPDILPESDNFEAEYQEKKSNKTLKNWLVCGAFVIVALAISKNHQRLFAMVGGNQPESEPEKIEQLASPKSVDSSPQLLSGTDYYLELLPQVIDEQKIEVSMQNNRMIWLLKNNLLEDAKKAKGYSAEEYLLNRMRLINIQWQEKIADRKFDFSSAIGLEEGLLLIPRMQALILAYEEITGRELEIEKFQNGDRLPPNFAPMIANSKQIRQIAENIRAGMPEAQLRDEILEERILKKLDEKLQMQNPNQGKIKEESAP